jgi:hypothetical protein
VITDINEKILDALTKREGDKQSACDFATGVVRAYGAENLSPFVNRRLLLAMMENGDFLDARNEKEKIIKRIYEISDFKSGHADIAAHYYKHINAFDYTANYKDKVLQSTLAVVDQDYPDPKTWLDKTVYQRVKAMDGVMNTVTRSYDPENVLGCWKEKPYLMVDIQPYKGDAIFAEYSSRHDMVFMYGYVGEKHPDPDMRKPITDNSEKWYKHYEDTMGYDGLWGAKINRTGFFDLNVDDIDKDKSGQIAVYIPILQSPQEMAVMAAHETTHRLQKHVTRLFERNPQQAYKSFSMTKYDYDLECLSSAVYHQNITHQNYLNNKEETLCSEVEKFLFHQIKDRQLVLD